MEKITYAVTVTVAGGPSLPIAGELKVDGYEKLDISVAAKVGTANGTADVAVAPGELAAVLLLVITPSVTNGTLAVRTSANGAADIPLTGPITLIGTAAVSLLGAKPDRLVFTNSGGAAASVTILVGRKATAAPAPPP